LRRGFLLGFDEFNQNYLIFNYKSHRIINTHNVTFNKAIFPKKVSNDPITFSIKQEEEEKTPTDTQAPNSLDTKESSDKANPILQQETPADQFTLKVIPPKPPIDHPNNANYQRRSTRIANRGAQANTTKHSLIQQAEYDNPKFKAKRFRNIQQSKFRQRWLDACVKEISGMKAKQVYSLTLRPTNWKVIKGRWVLKVKSLPDGSISKYKACFVAKGYTQEEGIDYDQTFLPTGKPSSLQFIIALATKNNWAIKQMDAVAAFLNNDLKEEIYLEQPEGFEDGGKDKVWRLHKSIYGLKQSARLWHLEVEKHLTTIGFSQTEANACVFF
jgi:hypothetical protein